MDKKIIFYSFLEIILIIAIFKVLGNKSSKIIIIGLIAFYSLKTSYEVSLILNSENPIFIIKENLQRHIKELIIVFLGYLLMFFYFLKINTYVDCKIILLFVLAIFIKEVLLLYYAKENIGYLNLPKKLFILRRGFRILLVVSLFFAVTMYSVLKEHPNKLYFLWISFALLGGYFVRKALEKKISPSKLTLSFIYSVLNIYTVYNIIEFSFVFYRFPLSK